MACYLMAPSHYLNQCCLKITGIPLSNISQKMLSQVPGMNGFRCQGQKIPLKIEVKNITADALAHYVIISFAASILTTYYKANMSLFHRIKDFTYVHNLGVEKESTMYL